ncbi:carboxymuconolactone decarboxylase family protein [Dactylosporangium sp. NPDC049742]|uniref:carboxymuconolactone decarboxylase family protein n=1 Tax=Dactylosporangium sp. NPDC049742 TaxID=3154737 RepID=UPI00343EEF40
MNRLPLVTPQTADPRQAQLLDDTQRQLGRVPNLYAALANGPQALAGYLALRDALTRGVLRAKVREQLALLVAQENGCAYCVAAHVMRSGRLGMTDEQVRDTRLGEDADPHVAAILSVAHTVLHEGGRVSDEQLAAARAAGVTDAELAEIVAHVALNVLSNAFNHLAQPELDFPPVDLEVTR